ncbi:MAG: putative flippase AglD2 [Candidatus Methanohalarchaeum thermophilum]|uniref:Flippase AglD2 n=1 Tax=Methanohalarchaeum thermophilum TaxID=1903181 RepID=A0A1Q6DT38_METT1|nr:MAG: putative flippase AglD2 [Candidatus Methanohalarchaeum thermophilum]
MRKSTKYLLFSLSISFLTIGALIYSSTKQGLWRALYQVKLSYVFVAVLLHVSGWFFWAIRTQILSRTIGLDLSFRRVFEVILSSNFVACLTPAFIGGEASRIYFLRDSEDGSMGKSSAIVFGERFLDLIFLVFVGGLSLAFISRELFHIPRIELLFLVLGLAVTLIISIVLVILYSPEHVKKLFRWIGAPLDGFRPGSVESINHQVDSFQEGIMIYLKRGKGELITAFGFTVILWTLEFSIPFVIIEGVGGEILFLEAWSSYPLVLGVMMIPLTPGSSGVAEIGFTAVYSTIAEIPSIGIVVLLWRFSTYYMNLSVGGFLSSVYLKNLDAVERKIEST